MTEAGNLLKSLGPNDQLANAVAELNNLLRTETSIVVAQIHKTTSDIQKTSQQLAVSMNRIEGMSASSHASIEEVKGKMDAFISNTERSSFAVLYLTFLGKYDLDDELAQLRLWLEPVEHH